MPSRSATSALVGSGARLILESEVELHGSYFLTSVMSVDFESAGNANLAKARGVSVNRLIDELATVALTEYDSETRFRAMAARGSKEACLDLIAKLDLAFQKQ